METTVGFAKEFPSIPVCGFNVYHKNRLIRVSFGKAEVTSPCNPICLCVCVCVFYFILFFASFLCIPIFVYLYVCTYIYI